VIKKRSSSHHPGARRWKSRFLVIKKRYRRGKEPEASDAVAASGCKAGRKCLTTQARERQKQAKEEPFLARIKSRNEKWNAIWNQKGSEGGSWKDGEVDDSAAEGEVWREEVEWVCRLSLRERREEERLNPRR
jgi:hypothetical protein